MFNAIKLRLKVNTLENEIDELHYVLKNHIVNEVITRWNKIEKYDQLLEENKRLKLKIKKLQETIKKDKGE